MYVPNYVPPPLEVPGNVTEERYRDRVSYIRRVEALHVLSLLTTGAISLAPLPQVDLLPASASFVAFLLVLCLVRIGARATRLEVLISVGILPAVLLSAALLLRAVDHLGYPLWAVVVGPTLALVYGAMCGRDFSFVGQYLLALIASSVVLAVIATQVDMSPRQAAFALGANTIFLFYWVYDMASLLARRRIGEEVAAVVDLYRDVLNIFGYVVRVARHWKKHRIWAR